MSGKCKVTSEIKGERVRCVLQRGHAGHHQTKTGVRFPFRGR
jgi:hypothetical protein